MIKRSEQYLSMELVGINEIAGYIRGLDYASHGSLSAYWTICERGHINARFFITNFPSTSGVFKTKKRLWSNIHGYEARRWTWIRKIIVKLRDLHMISVKPIYPTVPNIAICPARKFAQADYILSPLVKELKFKFHKGPKVRVISNIVGAHKFLREFIPRRIRYSSQRKSLKKKIERYRMDLIIISFLNA